MDHRINSTLPARNHQYLPCLYYRWNAQKKTTTLYWNHKVNNVMWTLTLQFSLGYFDQNKPLTSDGWMNEKRKRWGGPFAKAGCPWVWKLSMQRGVGLCQSWGTELRVPSRWEGVGMGERVRVPGRLGRFAVCVDRGMCIYRLLFSLRKSALPDHPVQGSPLPSSFFKKSSLRYNSCNINSPI